MARTRLVYRGLIAVALLTPVAACSGSSPARFPVSQGWVVSSSQSANFGYDFDTNQLTAGSVTVTLADGTSAVITARTHLDGACQELLPPTAAAQPCWLQIGPADSAGSAEWVTALGVRGDTGQPETWHQDHDRYNSVAVGGTLDTVLPDALVFRSGLVVSVGDTSPAVIDGCDADALEALVGMVIYAVLDIGNGDVTAVGCPPQV